MIKGITHDIDGLSLGNVTWRGKISTGYAPGEAPGGNNRGPQQAGFFRVMREEVTKVDIPGTDGESTMKSSWKLNAAMQKLFQDMVKADKPTLLQFTCMYRTPEELWDSFVGMYSKGGLICRSNGENSVAEQATVDMDGKKSWAPRVSKTANGTTTNCQLKNCPDFIAGKCMLHGRLRVFPQFDLSINPYRFDTQSEQSIVQIESMLNQVWFMLGRSHALRCQEAGVQIADNGLLGTQWFLQMTASTNSRGSTNYIVKILPSKALQSYIMEPIKKSLTEMSASYLKGETVGFLESTAAQPLAIASPESVDGDGPSDLAIEKEIDSVEVNIAASIEDARVVDDKADDLASAADALIG